MRHIQILLIILSLLVATLACNLGATTPVPTATIAVSTEAVESLLEKLRTAEAQAQAGGEVELSVSEAELTSLIAFELAQSQPQTLSDVQVYLRAGQMQIFATYRDGDLTVPLSIVAQPEVSEAGGLRVVLVSAKLGPVTAPDVLRNQVQTLLDEQVAQSLNVYQGQTFQVSEVIIADGFLTVRGSALP